MRQPVVLRLWLREGNIVKKANINIKVHFTYYVTIYLFILFSILLFIILYSILRTTDRGTVHFLIYLFSQWRKMLLHR